jgi:hypothetical protein
VPRELERAIRDAGLTVEEYGLVSLTLFPAYLELQLRDGGIDIGSEVPDHHVEFVRQNQAQIESLLERLERLN